jgi:hypothetical protein
MSEVHKSKRGRGRPAKPYDPHVAKRICRYISTTSYSLKKICRKKKGLPKPTTIYGWLLDNEDFAKMYAQAKEHQVQALADQIIEIADKARIGKVEIIDHKGKKKVRTGDMVQRAHLQIDARKWILAKLVPHKYGDKFTLDTGQNNLPELLASMGHRHKKIGGPEGLRKAKKSASEDED